jgi:hypothetical protein
MLGGLIMTKRLLISAALLAACLAPTSSHATGGTWCDLEDASMNFHFKAVQSRDGTGAWFDISGSLETKFGKLPKHLAKFDIKDENLTMRWLGREGILLQVQKYDSEPFAAVMLTVVTKSIDEGPYEGTYDLRITADGGSEAYLHKEGKIRCDAD